MFCIETDEVGVSKEFIGDEIVFVGDGCIVRQATEYDVVCAFLFLVFGTFECLFVFGEFFLDSLVGLGEFSG